MDDLRYRAQQPPLGDNNMGSFASPPRNGTRAPQQSTAHDPRSDPRSVLPRRFTTDSGRVPTLSSLTSQRVPEQDMSTSAAMHKVQLLEKKKLEYEKLREQKRRFEAEMQKLDQQQLRDEQELAAMQEDLGRIGAAINSGHQSEPTTPPEYRETAGGFPTMFSRPNRYSTSSLTSPPGLLFNRPTRSGSQIASPQSSIMPSSSSSSVQRYGFDDPRSVPLTRRNSDDDDKEEAVRQDPTSHRSTNAMNRYSMPVTRSKTAFYDISSLDQTNTTRFLFGEEEEQRNNGEVKLYQPAAPAAPSHDESFPTLTRREGQPHMLSASSAALDLALSQTPKPEANPSPTTWANARRHRTQPSLTGLPTASMTSSQSTTSSETGNLRNSYDMKYYGDHNDTSILTTTNGQTMVSPPKLQQSYSANDIATIKGVQGNNMVSVSNNHAQQFLHNHNASLGRIPPGALPSRHSRELSTTDLSNAMAAREYASIGTALQGNQGSYGPGPGQVPVSGPSHSQALITASSMAAAAAAASSSSTVTSMPASTAGNHYMANGYYNGGNYSLSNAPPVTLGNPGAYGPNTMPMLAQTMQALALNNNGGPMYQAQGFGNFGPIYNNPQAAGPAGPAGPGAQVAVRDNQTRVMQNRRQLETDAMNRFNNMPLEAVAGTIYELCKDQHGCRYLQKQLENRIPEQVHMIWKETNSHVVELMTDPFGNYLCQKLLEYCNDDERTVLIQNAAQDMVRIALNQHGTRALQKMIEFISTDKQISIIIEALRYRVVDLIQDLNGNHVIQKCLNKLSPADAQFIFDAVGGACVEVGTHRHGCCVLQRCIDHASGDQKVWLIARITEEAVTLIQDPFGNYVVQYIIDLNDHNYTEPLVAQLRGRICALSRHKFSSNVVEKCLRCSLEPSRDMIVEELLTQGEIERLLRDSYANYVIQTALEYATPYMKVRLVECIRPHLAQIRSTPYGRRIQAKIQAYEARNGHTSNSSSQAAPADSSQGQIGLLNTHNRGSSSGAGIMVPTSAFSANGANGVNGLARPNGQNMQNMSNMQAMPNMQTMPNQSANPAAQQGRPMAGVYGAPPAFGRPGFPNGMPGMPGMNGMVPVSMPPNMAGMAPGMTPGMAPGMAPGMPQGNGADAGESTWL